MMIQAEQFKMKEEDVILDTFEFNIFDIEDREEKQRLVYSILDRNHFLDKFSIPQTQLINFLMALETKYNKKKNPFHNYNHGISVMQSTHFILQAQKCHTLLDDFTRFVTVVSALCHDVSHTGRTNIFEINSRSKLAIRYHDKSVML